MVHLEVGRAAAAIKAGERIRYFGRKLVLSRKTRLRKHISYAQTYVKQRCFTVVEIVRSVNGEIHDIASG